MDEMNEQKLMLLYSMPAKFEINGPAGECRKLYKILDSLEPFTTILFRTYTDLLSGACAFWELLATDATDRHHTPRNAPIVGIVHLPANKVAKDGDYYIYRHIYQETRIHKTRVLALTDALKEEETVDIKTIPLLVERAVKTINPNVEFRLVV